MSPRLALLAEVCGLSPEEVQQFRTWPGEDQAAFARIVIGPLEQAGREITEACRA